MREQFEIGGIGFDRDDMGVREMRGEPAGARADIRSGVYDERPRHRTAKRAQLLAAPQAAKRVILILEHLMDHAAIGWRATMKE